MSLARSLVALVCVSLSIASGQATRPESAATRPAGAVTLLGGPEELGHKLDFDIDPASDARMLVVRGRRATAGDAAFEVNGDVWGTASGFLAGTDVFSASMPLPGKWPGPKRFPLSIRPMAPGVLLDEVQVVPASRVRFVIRDQGTKAEIPGFAGVESIDGREPPFAGPAGGFPRERAGWISRDGHGDLYLPPGSTAGFAGRSTPFRGIHRQKHLIEARDNMLVTFLLSSDQLPEGAVILEGPPRPNVPPDVQRAVDRARGIGRRPTTGFKVVPAADIIAAGPLAVENALANPDYKFIATNETGSLLFPPVLLATVELPGGELLHSNGPVILLANLRREGNAVRAFVKVRLPEGVVADHLVVRTGKTKVDTGFSGPSTIPLDVIVPPGTPIALVAVGPENENAPLERAAAFRIILAP